MAAGLYVPDPYARPDTTQPDVYARIPGTAAMPSGDLSGMAAMANFRPPFDISGPTRRAGPDILANPATQQWKINDFVFDADDDASALESEALLGQQGTGETPAGWERVEPEAYAEYLRQIKDPTLGRLAKRNFGRGVDIQQMLLGRGLQWAGAEQTGAGLVERQMEDLRKTSPYERQFTDIGSAHNQGPIDWLVANFAQQGPNLIESLATGLTGYGLGASFGGTAMSQGGQMLAKMTAKTAWKDGVKKALEKKLAGGTLDAAETKLLREAAGLTGAVAASYAQNVGTGIADIYGEARESGAGPGDNDARWQALAGSAPYALLETIPEYLLASRVLNPGNLKRPLAGLTLAGKAGELAKRGAAGFAVGGTAEGLTETGQELLVLGANPDTDFDSPEGVNRLVNSFAAGFGIGGPIGGAANLASGHPVNIANPADTTDPVAPPRPEGTPPVGPSGQLEMPFGPGNVGPPRPFDPRIQPYGPEEIGPPAPSGQQEFNFGPEQLGLFDQGNRPVPTQMPILPGDVSPWQPPGVPPATEVSPGQMAMDFSEQQGFDFGQQEPYQQSFFGGGEQAVPTQMPGEVAPQAPPGVAPATAFNPDQRGLFDEEQMDLFAEPVGTERPPPVGLAPQGLLRGKGRMVTKGKAKLMQAARQAPAKPAKKPLKAKAAPKEEPKATPPGARGLKRQAGVVEEKKIEGAPAAAPVVTPPPPVKAKTTPPAAPVGEAKGKAKLTAKAKPKEAPNALQERGTAQVPPREPSGTGEEMGFGVSEPKQAARTLKRGAKKAAPSVAPAGQKETVRKDEVAPAVTEKRKTDVLAPLVAEFNRLDRASEITKHEAAKLAQHVVESGLLPADQAAAVEEYVDRDDTDANDVIGYLRPLLRERRTTAAEAASRDQAPFEAQMQMARTVLAHKEKPAVPKTQAAAVSPVVAAQGKEGTPSKAETTTKTKTMFSMAEGEPALVTREVTVEKKPPKAVVVTDEEKEETGDRTSWRREIQATINLMERAKNKSLADRQAYVRNLTWLFTMLYEKTEGTKHIQQYLDTLFFGGKVDSLFTESLEEVMRKQGVLDMDVKELRNKQGEVIGYKGEVNPLFQYITRAEMFHALKEIGQYRNLPATHAKPSILPSPAELARQAETRNKLPKRKPRMARGKFALTAEEAEEEVATPEINEEAAALAETLATERAEAAQTPPAIRGFPAALALSNAIMNINGSVTPIEKAGFNRKVKELTKLFLDVLVEGTQGFTTPEGQPLSAYFVDGKPQVSHANKAMKVQTEETARMRTAEVSAETQATMARKAQAEREKAEEAYTPVITIDDWSANTFAGKKGRYFRDDGTPITAPVERGRIRMIVRQFVSKLHLKPLVHVYRSQADFQDQNPDAYARAKAAYPHDDFDTVSGVGYSFGHEIVVFTDRVATVKQLKFVLAHETLGHFGFRALMPEKELTAILHAIYEQSPHIRAVADMTMEALGLSKAEAVEEYLADFAGVLENNVLQRVWNRVKDFLKIFGLNFEDDMARYLLSQSRAYVRNGATHGSFVNFRTIAQRWLDIETLQDPLGVGRFSVMAAEYGFANRLAVEAARNIKYDDKMAEFNQALLDKGINLKAAYRNWASSLTTMNYAARNNFGFRKMYEILRDTVHQSSMLRSKYNHMMRTVLQPAVQLGSKQFSKGATQAQIGQTGKMLKVTALTRSLALTDNKLRTMGGLFTYVDGEAKRVPDTINELKAMGRIPIEQFRKGFTYTTYQAMPITAERKAEIEAERAEALKGKTAPKEIKDINAEYDDLKNADTYMGAVSHEFAAMPTLDENSIEWKMYLEVRDTVDEAALDLLHANFAAVKGERDNILRIVRRFLGRDLEDTDRKFIEKIETKYLTMRKVGSKIDAEGMIKYDKESIDKANKFMAKFNEMVLANETDKYPELKEFLESKEYDDVISGLTTLKTGAHIAKDEKRRYTMQQAIQNLAMFEMGRDDAHLFAKRTIAGGYVPFGREGAWQVRVNAVDPVTKRVYKVHDLYRQSLIYMQMDDKAESLHSAAAINRIFEEGNASKSFMLKVLDTDNQWRVKTVLLEAKAETARETAPASKETNLNEIISTLSKYSIDLHPEERERLVTGLTEQNHRARTRLRRAASPGEDPNVIKYVSQHLEATASTVARKLNRHHLDRLFDQKDGNSERLWKGDEEAYQALKKRWEEAQTNPALNEAEKMKRKMEFTDYHYTYKVKDAPTHGNKYLDDATRLLAFLDAQKDVEFTDFGSSEAVSKARLYMTFAMMGLSPATALLNFLSLGTNVVPALAGYNEKNGFGGGFGLARSSTEMSRALGLVKNDAQSDVGYWSHLLERVDENDPTSALKDPDRLVKAGFTEAEAMFMRRQVGSGAMQAALTNAMLGSARGKLTSGLAQKAAKSWMFLFNYSEQVARRSTGLATFRMAFERELQAQRESVAKGEIGQAEAEAKAFLAAEKFAVEMIDNTLGQYAMFNRPAWFRGGFGQFVFMYKMFPVNAWQMLKSMSRNQKLLALGLLMLFSGIKGLPFAEDIMDVLDTLAQMLGLGPNKLWRGSAEKTLASFLNWVSPGMTPLMLRGVVNHVLPANISDRTSLGNIVPGSGIFLAGADTGRELVEIGGPFASFVQGSIATAGRTAKLMLDPSEASLITTLRGSPVTMMRAAGDTWAYTNAGAIVNQRGYVVSRDLHAGVKLIRMLGFYPSSAVSENDVVKMGTRLSDYRKDIAAHFYSRYIMASMSKDAGEVGEVLDDVVDWNESARGTELELPNFRASARRALRAAKRTTTERYLRTIPRNARKEVEHIKEMLLTESEEAAAL